MPERASAAGGAGADRQALRDALAHGEPAWRVIAEDVLGLRTRIDLVAVDGNGRGAAIVLAEPGRDGAALTRALAHRAWLEAHLPDWARLAPDLGLDPQAGVQAILVAPRFDPETLAAAEALPAGWVALRRLREGVASPAGTARLEAVDGLRPPAATDARGTGGERPTFRSGLSARELGLSEEESRHFE